MNVDSYCYFNLLESFASVGHRIPTQVPPGSSALRIGIPRHIGHRESLAAQSQNQRLNFARFVVSTKLRPCCRMFHEFWGILKRQSPHFAPIVPEIIQ